MTALFVGIPVTRSSPKRSSEGLFAFVQTDVIFLLRLKAIFTYVFLAFKAVFHTVSPPDQASVFRFPATL